MSSPGAPLPTGLATRANALTALRLAAAPALALALLQGAHGVAFGLFWLAVATDLLDGRVARAYGESSAFGALLDHATDALTVSLGLGALAALGAVPWPLPVLVAAAFLQYALDSRSLARRPRPLRASRLGRWNGIAYFVLLGFPVCRDGLALDWPGAGTLAVLGWALVATTLASMADRALSWRASRRA